MHELQGLTFLLRNLLACRLFSLQPIPEITFENQTIRSVGPDILKEADFLYQKLRGGRALNFWRRVLLRIDGKKICIAAISEHGRPVGLLLYYFREVEWKRGIIHAACIGVDPAWRQQGLANVILRHSLSVFGRESKLKGVSNQILSGNVSMDLAQNAGFEIQSTETTSKDSKEIIHLYCDLQKYRHKDSQ